MRDEIVYHEYANWKIEYDDLLKYLLENDSDLTIRFKHVIDVVDHLYDKLIDDPDFTDDEHHIFETGFYYVEDQIYEISKLLKSTFKDDVKALEQHAKDINLLLSTIDFQNELMGVEGYEEKDMETLVNFEKDILEVIESKQVVSKELYETIDETTLKMFQRLELEYYPVNDVFLEIADELGIL